LIKFLPETKRILGEHELVLESKVNQEEHGKNKEQLKRYRLEVRVGKVLPDDFSGGRSAGDFDPSNYEDKGTCL
jgi:hypothetical protein